ncbi:MAG: gephyrin-like molybdotransferase Glp [Candidatus Thermoplasmatota archaeon]
MRPLKALVSLDDALAMLMGLAEPIRRLERLPLLDAHRRIAAKDVVSTIHVPLVDRAAMDGFAVRASDTYGSGRMRPVTLRRVETLHAATGPRRRVTNGKCVEVATGSTLPWGADAVVMVEDTEREWDRVRVHTPVHPGENVSPQGEDIRRGEAVVRAGDLLTPAKIGAVAAVGRDDVDVFAKPRVAILTTGDEVVPPGRAIRPGQVYDINAHTMACAVRESGGEPVLLGRVPDRMAALRAAVRNSPDYDLMLFSGGSSVGEKDMIIDALQAEGEVRFHGVAVKPGKPTVLGVVRGTPVLGMPGYPTSCLSNCYMLLAPMLRRMARLPPEPERVLELPLSKRLVSAIGRVEFHTVRVQDGKAVPAYKESGAITSMAHADGYIEIPANVDLVDRGETVRVVLF